MTLFSFMTVLKKIAIAAAGLGLLLITGWLGASLWLNQTGARWLIERVSTRYGVEADVESVRTNYLTTLTIRGLSVQKPVRLTATDAVASFRPWNFLFPGPDRWVLAVRLQTPELHVDLPNSTGSPRRRPLIPRVNFPFTTYIDDGSVTVQWKGRSETVKSVTGRLDVLPLRVRGDVKGESATWGGLSATGQLRPVGNRAWEVDVKTDNLPLESLWTNLGLSTAAGTMEGPALVRFHAEGGRKGKGLLTRWNAEVRGSQLSYRSPRGGAPIPFSVNAALSPESISVRSLEIGPGLSIQGTVTEPFGRRNARLEIALKGFELSDAQMAMGMNKPALTGTIDGSGTLTGPLSHYRFDATVSGSPRIKGVRLSDLSGAVTASPQMVRAELALAGGSLRLEADGDDADRVFRLAAGGVSLNTIARTNGWSGIGGTLDGSALVDPFRARTSGHLTFRRLEWGRFKSTGPVTASFDGDRQGFRLGTTETPFSVAATANGDHWQVERARLSFGSAEVELRGTVPRRDGSVKLTLKARNLPADLWPPFLARYPDLGGAVDAQGVITGSLREPHLRADLIFHGMRFVSDGETWNGDAVLTGGRTGLALENLRVDGGYRGQARWNRGPGGPRWTADLILENAAPALLFELAKASVPADGFLDGRATLEGSAAGLVGRSSVTWSAGRIKDFRFDSFSLDAEARPDRIAVTDLRLVAGTRALRTSGEATRSGRHWRYDALTQLQRWGAPPLHLDGEIRSEGTLQFPNFELNGRIRAPIAWVADHPIENLEGRISAGPGRWSVSGSAAPNVQFDLAQASAGARVTGRIAARAFSLETLLTTLLGPDNQRELPQGSADIALRLGWPRPNAVHLSVAVPEASWRNEVIDGEVEAIIEGSTVTLGRSRLELAAGGAIALKGNIYTGATGGFALEASGTDLNLQSLVHLLRWPVRWNGLTNADLTVSGPLRKPRFEASFSGEHEGFGPFRKGGRLDGVVRGTGGEWDLSGIRVDSGGGYLKLTEGSRLYVDKTRAGTLRLVGDVRNLGLGVLTLFGRAEVAGRWSARTPTPDGPRRVIELDVFARSLWINQFVLDGNVTHLTVRKGEIDFSPIVGSGQQLSGRLEYKDYPDLTIQDLRFLEDGQERVFLDGRVGSKQWDYRLRVNGLDASVVRGLLDTTLPLSGPLEADVVGKGSLREPVITGNVTWRDGQIASLPLDVARFRLNYSGNRVSITDIDAERRRGYALSGAAHFSVGDAERRDPDIDVIVTKGDAALLTEIFPGVSRARGSFEGRFRMGVKGGKPQMSGRLVAQKVSLTSDHLPRLDRGELDVTLTQNKLTVNQAYARIGEGRAALTGFVELENNRPSRYSLALDTLSSKGIAIRVPELAIAPGLLGRVGLFQKSLAGISRGEPRVRLTLTGPATGPLLAGDIHLENTVFTYPPQKSPGKTGEAGPRWWRDFARSIRWDVSLRAGERTWYQNELVDAKITGGLRFSGFLSALDVDGRIFSEQGAIVYSGNEFVVKEADLEVQSRTGPLLAPTTRQTLVYLRVNAEKEVFYTDGLSNSNQDTIVMVVDRSLLGEIQPRFYSKNNPNLSSQRALQLALGLPFNDSIEDNLLLPDQRARGAAREDTDKMLRVGLVQLLDSSLASPLARAIARRTGLVDFIRVTYQEQDDLPPAGVPTATEGSTNLTQNEFLRYAKGTKVRFGRELSRRLFADYSFRVDEYQQQIDLRHEVELAYRLRRNLYLRGVTELEPERTLGRPPDRRAIIENQWRFGLPRRKTDSPDESRVLEKSSGTTDAQSPG